MRRIYCVNVSERTWMSEELSSSKFFVHSQEQLDGSYKEVDAETKTGTTGTKTAAVAKVYAGFTAQAVTQQPIAANGSTVIEIKYNRNEIPFVRMTFENLLKKTQGITADYLFFCKQGKHIRQNKYKS